MRRILCALAFSLAAGCATGPTNAQLTKRAAFDLNCPEDQLEIVKIDDRTNGVRGCDQRVTYVSQCKPCANGYVGCECTWVLNADGRTDAQ